MSVMKIDIELSTTDLLRAAGQLPPGELHEFTRQGCNSYQYNKTESSDTIHTIL